MDISIGKKILKFEGDNCGACRAMEPTWNKLKEKNINIDFQKVKVEENRDLVEFFSITAVPTFITVNNGEELERVIGIVPENRLQNLINLLK